MDEYMIDRDDYRTPMDRSGVNFSKVMQPPPDTISFEGLSPAASR